MKLFHSRARAVASVLLCIMPAVYPGTASSDDIDVYGINGRGPGARLPNVLFVFDTSESMMRQLDGSWDMTGPTRLSILHDAVQDMLDVSEGRINVGITSFNSTAQGIKWPVSALDQEASLQDPAVDAGVTNKDVISSIIAHDPSGGSTATVDALYEAARYFRGEPVWISGTSYPYSHRPHSWSTTNQRYMDGSDIAAQPTSYSPMNAYTVDGVTVPGSVNTCYDFTVGGTVAGATNYCDGLATTSCDAPTPSTRTWDPNYCDSYNSSYTWTCTKYDATGSECIQGEGSCSVNGGYTGTEAHQKCYYNGADYTYDTWDGATYNSPIGQSCQANIMVLLSDGAPSRNSAKSLVEALTEAPCEPLSDTIFGVADGSYDYGDCGPELTKYLNENDQHASIDHSRVTTYTIGFGLGGAAGTEAQTYLKALASAGGGEFLLADDSDQLTRAFDRIVTDITGGSETVAGLSVDVDKATGAHNDQGYLNLFQPSARQSWEGNMKGYYLRADGLHDVNDVSATEMTVAGVMFKDTAQSFWSTNPDGNEVIDGGANDQIAHSSRKLVTDLVKGSHGYQFNDAANSLSAANASLTPDMFGSGYTDEDMTAMIDWLNSASMGDPLHSRPVVVRYADRSVVYTMTNQGFLHAIDATSTASGLPDKELFAFMPVSLLKNVPALKANSYTGAHIYGLDGSMSLWHDDSVTRDGLVNPGEKVLLFFGMRRGGKSYYAMDISDVAAPKLLWKIDPGVAGFSHLGQSWSRLSLVKMPWLGSTRRMLVFGGGYDAAYDDAAVRVATSTGNAIYFVDPETGELLWSVSASGADTNNSAMVYPIPADLRIIDMDANGIADRIYAGDLGGQVWRIKLDEASFGNSSGVQVIRLAGFSDDTAAGDRRFFYPPTAYHSVTATDRHVGISIGSGDRTNPLSVTAQNRVYALRDSDTQTAFDPGATGDLGHSQLVDVTTATTDVDQLKSDLAQSDGWYFNLATGEKALSPIVAFEGQLLFTTYAPSIVPSSTSSDQSCSIGESVGRFYALNQANATSGNIIDQADQEMTTGTSRFVNVEGDGILGPPVIVFPEGKGAVDVYVDKSKIGTINQRLRNIFWHAR